MAEHGKTRGKTHNSLIIGAKRGSCHFVTKTRNAEYAGANLLVIFDTKIGDDLEKMVMKDDGTGWDLTIPTVMISKSKGDAIIEYYEANPTTHIQILYHFDLN